MLYDSQFQNHLKYYASSLVGFPHQSPMLLPRFKDATAASSSLPSLHSSPSPPNHSLNPETVVAIVFGITMLILALLGLWQNYRRQEHAGSVQRFETTHSVWFGSGWAQGSDFEVDRNWALGLYVNEVCRAKVS